MMIQTEEDKQGDHGNNGETDQRCDKILSAIQGLYKILSAIQGLYNDGGDDDDEDDLY